MPRSLCDQHHLGERLALQFLHDMAAMPFDRAFGAVRLGSDVPVHPATNDQGKTLRSVGVKASTRAARHRPLRVCRDRLIARNGPRDGVEQHFGGDRFGQKILGARLHGQNTGRNVAMAGKKDDRQLCRISRETLLQLQAVEPRHAEVQENAAGSVGNIRARETPRPIRTARPDNRPPSAIVASKCARTHRHRSIRTIGADRHACLARANGNVK